ncbi:MAG: histidine kinase [Parafilimonas sp.]
MQIQITNGLLGPLTDNKGNKMFVGKNSNYFKDLTEYKSGIKLLCEGPGGTIYVADENNNFGCMAYTLGTGVMMPPFNFYNKNDAKKDITAIWISDDSDLYVAANTDTFYVIKKAAKLFSQNSEGHMVSTYMPEIDKDSNFVTTRGVLPIKKISLGDGVIATSFAQGSDDGVALIGTNKGLYGYDTRTAQSINYLKNENDKITITNIHSNKLGTIIWFSTLEKGIGKFNALTNSTHFFTYPKRNANDSTKYPILNFSAKSSTEFFVAIADSLPAVFNTETGKYTFINDSIFHTSKNITTDIKADAAGNLYVTKGGSFYWSKTFLKNNKQLFTIDSSLFGPYITDILINGTSYDAKNNYYFRDELLKQINLKYNENKIEVFFSCRGIESDSLIFEYKLENYDDDWNIIPYSVLDDKMNMLTFDHLNPDTYTFRLKARSGNNDWLKNETELIIIIAAPFWQTWWFWLTSFLLIGSIVSFFIWWRIKVVKKREREKFSHEKQLMELEAQALRAQMNPHFIFNCMNSIKLLIQQKDEDNAINYLTTLSKLIRTIFQNSDKREITLYDEIATCRLYTQLESMRFGNKLNYTFSIDETIDLKLLMVPALIIQPFIENAIWHGIMPKEEGGELNITVKKEDEYVCCIIDDNGIGRKMSKQNKFKGDASTHQSKGMHLTQSRIDLDNLLNERKAFLEIIDKKKDDGISAGTTVILKFREY